MALSRVDLFMCFGAGINVSPLCKIFGLFVSVMLVRLIMLWLSVLCDVCPCLWSAGMSKCCCGGHCRVGMLLL